MGTKIGMVKIFSKLQKFDRIDGEPMEFEWNIFPGFNTLQLSEEVKSLLYKLGETPEILTGRILCMSMFNDFFLVEQETMKKNVWQMLDSYLCMQEDLEKDNGHSLVLVLRKSGMYCIKEDTPQKLWDKIAERMVLKFAESGCPIFRATSPLSRGRLKRKGHGKLSIHYAADLETIETIFRIIVSANQLSLYGAVAEMCEEYETLHDRTGQPAARGATEFLICAKRDQDRSAFGL